MPLKPALQQLNPSFESPLRELGELDEVPSSLVCPEPLSSADIVAELEEGEPSTTRWPHLHNDAGLEVLADVDEVPSMTPVPIAFDGRVLAESEILDDSDVVESSADPSSEIVLDSRPAEAILSASDEISDDLVAPPDPLSTKVSPVAATPLPVETAPESEPPTLRRSVVDLAPVNDSTAPQPKANTFVESLLKAAVAGSAFGVAAAIAWFALNLVAPSRHEQSSTAPAAKTPTKVDVAPQVFSVTSSDLCRSNY